MTTQVESDVDIVIPACNKECEHHVMLAWDLNLVVLTVWLTRVRQPSGNFLVDVMRALRAPAVAGGA